MCTTVWINAVQTSANSRFFRVTQLMFSWLFSIIEACIAL